MAFNSIYFFIFLLSVVIGNYFINQKYRVLFLSIASIFFITYYSVFSAVILLASSFSTFYLAKNTKKTKLFLYVGIAFNSILILLFNYFVFKNNLPGFEIAAIGFDVNSFVIALGLSFYSLQNISYLIEVYSGRYLPEKKFINYFLYNAFFVKIISGPVLQSISFFPQLNTITITKPDLIIGFQRVLLGLCKKMVIADRLAPAVASVFDYNDSYSAVTTIAAVYLFTIQLYFDFSGYIDMALGAARMLGIKLPENFNLPLRATSIGEFWRRWHMTLINWFTNTIFYPLVYHFRKHKKMAAVIGIVATFLVSGVWHGIGFTFLVWAACHIVYLIVELFTKKLRLKIKEKSPLFIFQPIAVFIVFNLVCFSNIFFRADSFAKATQLIKNSLADFIPADFISDFIAPLAVGGHQEERFNFYISIFITSIFLLFERKINKIAINEKYNMFFVAIIFLLIFLLGIFNSGERFIYMQF